MHETVLALSLGFEGLAQLSSALGDDEEDVVVLLVVLEFEDVLGTRVLLVILDRVREGRYIDLLEGLHPLVNVHDPVLSAVDEVEQLLDHREAHLFLPVLLLDVVDQVGELFEFQHTGVVEVKLE